MRTEQTAGVEHRSLSWIVRKLIDLTKSRKTKDWDQLKDWSGEKYLNSLAFPRNFTVKIIQPRTLKEREKEMIKSGKL